MMSRGNDTMIGDDEYVAGLMECSEKCHKVFFIMRSNDGQIMFVFSKVNSRPF